jgi:hypothetical protein
MYVGWHKSRLGDLERMVTERYGRVDADGKRYGMVTQIDADSEADVESAGIRSDILV